MTATSRWIATTWVLAAAAVLSAQPSVQKDPWQTRSMVINTYGIVAASQPLAAEAGVRMLEQSGNAVDAAIAANGALSVVQPDGAGIGGDMFAIVYEAKTGKLYGLNASGWAPAGLSIEYLRSKGIRRIAGINAVTVPGVVAGWDALRKRFGRLPFSTLLGPAVYYARHGYPVAEMMASHWSAVARRLSGAPNFAATFLIDGRAPHTGEVFRNPDLARTLERIAEHGRDGFYTGPTAEAIVRLSEQYGGTMQLADLSEFQPEWVAPVGTRYRGWTIWELPPNGYGAAALSMLNLMERFPLQEYGHNSARALHVMIEAKKLAYADMLRYLGDPRFGKMPLPAMISKTLAAQRARLIDPSRANCSVSPAELEPFAKTAGHDTTYLSAIDRDGNIVSLIQSNFAPFGTGFVPPHAGFVLQSRGSGFTLEPGLPNSLAPRKRPLHTIIPAFMEKGDVRIGFGIKGGWNQGLAHAQFVSNIVDFGMNLQAAFDAARFTKLSFGGCDVALESRIPEQVRAQLARLGHQIQVVDPYSGAMGFGSAVMRDGGVNYAGSDPRSDGAAIPEPPPATR